VALNITLGHFGLSNSVMLARSGHDTEYHNQWSVTTTKLPDDGEETPKSLGRGWWFNPRFMNSPLYLTENLLGGQLPPVLLALACRPSVSKKEKEKIP
jgi:hypothetical protein